MMILSKPQNIWLFPNSDMKVISTPLKAESKSYSFEIQFCFTDTATDTEKLDLFPKGNSVPAITDCALKTFTQTQCEGAWHDEWDESVKKRSKPLKINKQIKIEPIGQLHVDTAITVGPHSAAEGMTQSMYLFSSEAADNVVLMALS